MNNRMLQLCYLRHPNCGSCKTEYKEQKNTDMRPKIIRSKFGSGIVVFMMIVLFWGGFSCSKIEEFEDIKIHPPDSWNPEIALPLGHATLTLQDILNQVGDIDFLYEDPDGMLRVYYRSSLISEYAGDIVKFDRQEDDTTVNLIFPVSLPVDDSLMLSYKFAQKFSNVEGDVVDSIRFQAGELIVEVESFMDHDARLVVTSPHIVRNNVPMRAEFDLSYYGSLPVSRSVSIDLNGYSLTPDHAAGGNDLHYYLDYTVYGDNNPDPGPYPVKVSVALDNLQYRVLFGQIANRSIAILNDVIELPMFANGLGGSFRVNDPRIGIHITNSFGIPISIGLDPLRGISDINPPYIVDLSGPGLPVPFLLNSPTIAQLGQRVKTSIELNKQNSNIDDFLNLLPQKIEYGVEGIINPAGVTPGNFMMDTSYFEVEVEIEIPLEGYASGFTLADTLEFSMDEDLDILEYILFRVNAESTFPFDARLQVTFLDENYQILDSLFGAPQRIIPGALPGPPPLYKSTEPAYATFDIRADRSKLANINQKARYMFLSAFIDTSGGGAQVVRIYTDNYLKMEMGVQAKGTLKINEI
jgi:hypothetical protein